MLKFTVKVKDNRYSIIFNNNHGNIIDTSSVSDENESVDNPNLYLTSSGNTIQQTLSTLQQHTTKPKLTFRICNTKRTSNRVDLHDQEDDILPTTDTLNLDCLYIDQEQQSHNVSIQYKNTMELVPTQKKSKTKSPKKKTNTKNNGKVKFVIVKHAKPATQTTTSSITTSTSLSTKPTIVLKKNNYETVTITLSNSGDKTEHENKTTTTNSLVVSDNKCIPQVTIDTTFCLYVRFMNEFEIIGNSILFQHLYRKYDIDDCYNVFSQLKPNFTVCKYELFQFMNFTSMEKYLTHVFDIINTSIVPDITKETIQTQRTYHDILNNFDFYNIAIQNYIFERNNSSFYAPTKTISQAENRAFNTPLSTTFLSKTSYSQNYIQHATTTATQSQTQVQFEPQVSQQQLATASTFAKKKYEIFDDEYTFLYLQRLYEIFITTPPSVELNIDSKYIPSAKYLVKYANFLARQQKYFDEDDIDYDFKKNLKNCLYTDIITNYLAFRKNLKNDEWCCLNLKSTNNVYIPRFLLKYISTICNLFSGTEKRKTEFPKELPAYMWNVAFGNAQNIHVSFTPKQLIPLVQFLLYEHYYDGLHVDPRYRVNIYEKDEDEKDKKDEKDEKEKKERTSKTSKDESSQLFNCCAPMNLNNVKLGAKKIFTYLNHDICKFEIKQNTYQSVYHVFSPALCIIVQGFQMNAIERRNRLITHYWLDLIDNSTFYAKLDHLNNIIRSYYLKYVPSLTLGVQLMYDSYIYLWKLCFANLIHDQPPLILKLVANCEHL